MMLAVRKMSIRLRADGHLPPEYQTAVWMEAKYHECRGKSDSLKYRGGRLKYLHFLPHSSETSEPNMFGDVIMLLWLKKT